MGSVTAKGGVTSLECRCGRVHDVVLVDRVAAFRRGLAAGLAERAFQVHESDRLDAGAAADAVVVTVRTHDDRETAADACARVAGAAVVVLAQPSVEDYLLTLGRGAIGVAAEDEPLDELVDIVAAACHGRSRLPSHVLRALSAQMAPQSDPPALEPRDLDWLRALAANRTVAQLARDEAYSEREMYRRLAGLYRRIGAKSRVDAVVLAARWGLAP